MLNIKQLYVRKHQLGYSLIELMVSMVIGLIILAATINIYIVTTKSSASTIKSVRLSHDMNSVMAVMVNDLRRSGYWRGANINSDSRTNAFTQATTNVTINDITAGSIGTCIMYTYDNNADEVVDANEYFGFRLNGSTIQMLTNGDNLSSTANCNNAVDTWSEMIDGSQLTIDLLEFSFFNIGVSLPSTSRCMNVTTDVITDAPSCAGVVTGDNLVEKRMVNIMMTGHLTSDATVTRTLSATVEVRNNRLKTAP